MARLVKDQTRHQRFDRCDFIQKRTAVQEGAAQILPRSETGQSHPFEMGNIEMDAADQRVARDRCRIVRNVGIDDDHVILAHLTGLAVDDKPKTSAQNEKYLHLPMPMIGNVRIAMNEGAVVGFG
nr:hypothetical protein [Rhizobium lusitanum]